MATGSAPWWPVLLLGLAILPGLVPLPFDAGYLTFALLLAGLGWYGVLLWRLSNVPAGPEPDRGRSARLSDTEPEPAPLTRPLS